MIENIAVLAYARIYNEPPNGSAFSRRKRTAMTAKKRTISRAKRSAGTPCWAAWIVAGRRSHAENDRVLAQYDGRGRPVCARVGGPLGRTPAFVWHTASVPEGELPSCRVPQHTCARCQGVSELPRTREQPYDHAIMHP